MNYSNSIRTWNIVYTDNSPIFGIQGMNRGSAEKARGLFHGGENMDSNYNFDLIVKNAMIYTMDREGRVIRRGSVAI